MLELDRLQFVVSISYSRARLSADMVVGPRTADMYINILISILAQKEKEFFCTGYLMTVS